jgi:hypothetical protein
LYRRVLCGPQTAGASRHRKPVAFDLNDAAQDPSVVHPRLGLRTFGTCGRSRSTCSRVNQKCPTIPPADAGPHASAKPLLRRRVCRSGA